MQTVGRKAVSIVLSAILLGAGAFGISCLQPVSDSSFGIVQEAFAASKISTSKQARSYAKKYYKKKHMYTPGIVAYSGKEKIKGKSCWVIHGYDDMGTHTATSFWYGVTKSGQIYDMVMCRWIKK